MSTRDDGPQIKAELDKVVEQLGEAIRVIDDLHARALAVAEEYEREPRLIASGAVASMLREWTGQFR